MGGKKRIKIDDYDKCMYEKIQKYSKYEWYVLKRYICRLTCKQAHVGTEVLCIVWIIVLIGPH